VVKKKNTSTKKSLWSVVVRAFEPFEKNKNHLQTIREMNKTVGVRSREKTRAYVGKIVAAQTQTDRGALTGERVRLTRVEK
jgi:ribosomal protein L35AE/L33A